jgi:hypothetical protein
MARRAPWIVLGAVLLAVGGGGTAWWHARERSPDPVPAPGEPSEEDTGLSRQAVEDRMRAIGYVQ